MSDEGSLYVDEPEDEADEQASGKETTPSRRLKQKEARSKDIKERINFIMEKLKIHRRCLIENTHPNNHIDYAHCLRRAQDRHSTRVPLENEARNGFILLPERDFIKGYFRKSRDDFPVIEDTILYKYKLIALEKMEHVPIFRETLPSAPQDIANPNDNVPSSSNQNNNSIDNFTLFHYPYKDFPILQTPVYPHYVIVDAGKKLLSITNLELIQDQFLTVLTSVEYPRLSMLKWVLSLLSDFMLSYAAMDDGPAQLDTLIQNQAKTLAKNQSNLTNDQLSELIRNGANVLVDTSLDAIDTLYAQLVEFQTRLATLENQYPEDVIDDLVLLVAVYFQWSTQPPPNFFLDQDSLEPIPVLDRPDDSSPVTRSRQEDSSSSPVTRSRTHFERESKRKRSHDNDNLSTPDPGSNKRRRTEK
ncbi:hypothetical protein Clacol_010554 [Clathrus columnatus]|uniref:Uncharacterized protein n=1 Tax=Clathrus columnatus TaxID=1419009 RepID=A0AAV5AUD5_9AGAM|nr:hypothetical protein Clacol_010554 [Clathrus columnatus]